ncbi:MAG: hypothetical protein Q8Q38_01380 [bacterium]|nr:hypothetical protein [bacterium]
MNKNLLLFLLITATVLFSLVVVYLLFFREQPEAPAKEEVGLPEIIKESRYAGEELGAEGSFVAQITSPLEPIDPQYQEVFAQAQDLVPFPILYPSSIPSGFALVRLIAWDEEGLTSGALAHYENSERDHFSVGVMTAFYPESFGPPDQTLQLANGEEAQAWVFRGVGVANSLVVFKTQEVDERTAYYTAESFFLSPQELLPIINSAL